MDDNTDAVMETDVSSTTDDISETQQVTGSHGNVEMVIVVEQLDEEETTAEDPKESSKLKLSAPETDQSRKDNEPAQSTAISPSKCLESDMQVNTFTSTNNDDLKPASIDIKCHDSQLQKLSSKTSDPRKIIYNSPTKQMSPQKGIQNCSTMQVALVKPIQNSSIKPCSLLKPIKTPEKFDSAELSPQNSHKKLSSQLTPNLLSPQSKTHEKSLETSDVKMCSEKQRNEDSDVSKSNMLIIPLDGEPLVVQQKHSDKIKEITENKLTQIQNCTPISETNETVIQEALATDSSFADIKSIESGNIDSKHAITPSDFDSDKDLTDSQLECNSDMSEKERELNKNISREMKSLINSAKESKIISECTQITNKIRKSRSAVDSPNSSVDAEKIQGVRRSSNNSQKSNSSDKSDITLKRSMRSQNPEFVNKVKSFLNSVTGKSKSESDSGNLTDEELDDINSKDKDLKKMTKNKDQDSNDPNSCSPKKKKIEESPHHDKNVKLRSDPYCWRCHWSVEPAASEKINIPPVKCTVCPRSFHYKCLTGTERTKLTNKASWVCPECLQVLQAESSETRSQAMRRMSTKVLSELLTYALQRMMEINGVEPFVHPVDRAVFPDYDKYVVHPMYLSKIEENIPKLIYGSTEAFLADVQWILHNSIIFNTMQSKLTAAARTLMRVCKTEMGEIEACPECYAGAHARRSTWFTDVCTTPHMLLWAKLKGFPYWPAKAMTVNSSGLVDVRFFGAHDRAWVPAKDCFLYSEKDPNNFRTKRQDIIDSMQEAEEHIRNISRKFGKFVYPPFKTQFDAAKLNEQLKMMIPSFQGDIASPVKDKSINSTPKKVKNKSRSNSKCSKDSSNDGDTSEGEYKYAIPNRKMADGAEIAREEEDTSVDKDNRQIEPQKEQDNSRKRRRSKSVDSSDSSKVKRKRIADEKKSEDKKLNESKVNITLEKPEENEKEALDIESKKTELEVNTSSDEIKKNILTPKTQAEVTGISKDNKNSPKLCKEITKINKTDSPKNDKIHTDTPKVNKGTPKIRFSNDKNTFIKVLSLTPKQHKNKTNVQNNKTKSQKQRRNSKTNKTLPSDNTVQDKSDNKDNVDNSLREDNKTAERDNSKSVATCETRKPVPVENSTSPIIAMPKMIKPTKERIQFDDNTSLAVIAREVSKSNSLDSEIMLPTISSVRSLSKVASNLDSSNPNKTSATPAKTIEISIPPVTETNSSPSINSKSQNVNDKEKTKNDSESKIGRVGVRAFARIPISPEPDKSNQSDTCVEIKTEPMDCQETEQHLAKMDLMNAFQLRPVNPSNVNNLRDVRTNKFVVQPAKKTVAKPQEARPRAKKTFPQPKKADDGRIELNSKNSMVYIPIQPPITQAPVPKAKVTTSSNNMNPSGSKLTTSLGNIANTVNTVTPPLMSITKQSSTTLNMQTLNQGSVGQGLNNMQTNVQTSSVAVTSVQNNVQRLNVDQVTKVTPGTSGTQISAIVQLPNGGQLPPGGQLSAGGQLLPAVGQLPIAGPAPMVGFVPTTVHTVPLLTSVNGQWTFSLQPVMSVGAADAPSSPPLINGLTERNNILAPQMVLPPSVTTASAGPNMAAPRLPHPVSTIVTTSNNTVVTSASETTLLREPPRLTPRPTLIHPLDPNAPVGGVPPPSTSGPLTAKLNQNAVKLTDFFRTVLEDSLINIDNPAAQLTALRLELEKVTWKHQQEVKELKHNHELMLVEMRTSFEKEKSRAISELRRTAQTELDAAVKLAKAKQWCANCNQEAQFYCCWNTSYCDYTCQRSHWAQHFAECTQQRTQDSSNCNNKGSNSSGKSLQPLPDYNPSSSAPTLISKLSATGPTSSKPSLIVSMVEDSSGNKTVKCVGTYKPGSQLTQSVIINKQLLSSEESKKVVTSGGYLIVGGSSGANTVVTPARRPHTSYHT